MHVWQNVEGLPEAALRPNPEPERHILGQRTVAGWGSRYLTNYLFNYKYYNFPRWLGYCTTSTSTLRTW